MVFVDLKRAHFLRESWFRLNFGHSRPLLTPVELAPELSIVPGVSRSWNFGPCRPWIVSRAEAGPPHPCGRRPPREA